MLPELVEISFLFLPTNELQFELVRGRRLSRTVSEFCEFPRVTARHENESGIVSRKLGEHPLEKLHIGAGQGCKAPFAVLVTALGLVKHSPPFADNHELRLRYTGVFDANALGLPVQHPHELRNRPPQFVAVSQFISWSTWKRH